MSGKSCSLTPSESADFFARENCGILKFAR
jgi:hypothetical protein